MMTPEERAGMAAAINEAIALGCAAVREACARELADVRRSTAEELAAVRAHAQRADERAEALQRELDATRELAAQAPIQTMLVDAVGDLHVVQRGGVTTTANLAALGTRIAAAVDSGVGALGASLRAEVGAHVAREVMRFGSAPRWSRSAFYGEGAVVSCYNGRTYELAPGTRASIAQEPGEHPEVWQRIGSHGLRVMKSKPAVPEPGDVYTEGESRFIFDGETTTLFVPRATKQSDIDRSFKAANSLAASAFEHATRAERMAESHEARLDVVEREASNNALWIAEEGEAAVLRSATTEAWVAERADEIDAALLDLPQPEGASAS